MRSTGVSLTELVRRRRELDQNTRQRAHITGALDATASMTAAKNRRQQQVARRQYTRTQIETESKQEPRFSAVTLAAFAAELRHLREMSIESWYAAPAPTASDRYLLPTGRSAANQPHAADRRTDRRTDTVSLRRRSPLEAGSVNNTLMKVDRPQPNTLYRNCATSTDLRLSVFKP